MRTEYPLGGTSSSFGGGRIALDAKPRALPTSPNRISPWLAPAKVAVRLTSDTQSHAACFSLSGPAVPMSACFRDRVRRIGENGRLAAVQDAPLLAPYTRVPCRRRQVAGGVPTS